MQVLPTPRHPKLAYDNDTRKLSASKTHSILTKGEVQINCVGRNIFQHAKRILDGQILDHTIEKDGYNNDSQSEWQV